MRAVITGAGSGLGRAFCLEVASRGGTVLVSDRQLEAAEETADRVRLSGGRAFVRLCDVADQEQVQALADAASTDLGPVDLLCNNAGVAVSGRFEAIDLDPWRWIMNINLWGVIHGCRSFLPAMRARGSGNVINVASAAGLLCTPDMAPYNVTKAAVVALTETLSAEYAGTGVNLTVLCPTFFETSILDNGRGPGTPLAATARARMKSSRIQAQQVARRAMQDVARGRLYSVPMRDGRILWRLKRLNPTGFSKAVGGVFRWRRSRRQD